MARTWVRRGRAAVFAATMGALLGAGGAAAQERGPRGGRGEECRCLDEAGNERERCLCVAMPEMDFGGMMALGRRAVLGVSVRQDQPERDDERGVRVFDVDEDSPAGDAGLERDDVLVSVDGTSLLAPLADERADERFSDERSLPVQRLLHLLGERDPGDTLRIEYLRGDERRTATAVLDEPRSFFRMAGPGAGRGPMGRLPVPPPVAGMRTPSGFRMDWVDEDCPGQGGSSGRARALIDFGRSCVGGVELLEMRAGLADYFGAAEGGVLVSDVRADNPLALRAGDVLLAIDGRAVRGVEQALRVLRSYEPDEEVRLRVLRRQETLELTGRVR